MLEIENNLLNFPVLPFQFHQPLLPFYSYTPYSVSYISVIEMVKRKLLFYSI